ncbi:MAG TPA: type II toxin-antitoxin system prevent-host-death family antitoxin, partial [Thermoanaerobaculia bacterium]
MKLTASDLRNDIYKILDRVLETGVPVEIDRQGKLLRIVPADPGSKLARLAPREYLNADPEEIVHLDWSIE